MAFCFCSTLLHQRDLVVEWAWSDIDEQIVDYGPRLEEGFVHCQYPTKGIPKSEYTDITLTASAPLTEVSNNGADERSDNWDPKVPVLTSECIGAPSCNQSEQTRSQVTGRVQGKTGLVTERVTDGGQGETNDQRLDVASGSVELVRCGKDDHDKESSTNELGSEGSEGGDIVITTTGDKDTNGLVVVGSTKAAVVEEVGDEGTEEGTEELSNPVDWDIGPAKAAEDGLREGHRGVKMTALWMTSRLEGGVWKSYG